MSTKPITFAIVIGAALTLILMISLAGASSPMVLETNLAPSGVVYEINPDAQGNLWVTDNGANEIRRVNPATGVYTIYHDMSHANDARMDASGNVWWTNYQDPHLGRIAVNTGMLTTWPLSLAGAPLGTAFDDAGHVWVSDETLPNVYRFDPTTSEVCTYSYSDADGDSAYLVWYAGSVWLGDDAGARIIKLDPVGNVFTIWQLAAGAHPEGLAIDESGNFWWSDQGTPAGLARLEPTINRLTSYTLPVSTTPEMIFVSNGNVWYTGNTVGVLNPTAASGITSTLAVTTTPVTPSCSTAVGTDSAVVTSVGNMVWTSNVYTRSTPAAGWTVYQLPPNASPWGIAVSGGRVWFTDQGRQVLAQMDSRYRVYVPIMFKQ
jgi:streptogramin lyase